MNVEPWIAFQIVGGALVAGLIQGLSGFAFGLVATSLWAWAIEPQLVVPTVVFGSFLGQIISVARVRSHIRLDRVAPFLISGLIGIPLGAALLPLLNVTVFRLAVGAVLVLYCSILLAGMRLPRIERGGRWGDLVVGFVAGVMGGVSALSGPPITLWCAMRGWPKEAQRATYQTFFISTQTLTLVVYVLSGVINLHSIKLFGLVAPPILLSSWLGSRWASRFSDERFMRMLLLVLLLSGLSLLASATHGLLTVGAR